MRTSSYDREEIRRYLQLKIEEKLTFQQLADQTGIPAHIFVYRSGQDRANSTSGVADTSRFAELSPPPTAPTDGVNSGITIHLAGGHRITLAPDFDAVTLGKLLVTLPC